MTTQAPPTRLYECMFLISQAEAANLNNALDHIREVLGRGDAEIVAMRKWDERRLAYEIDKQKRGVYLLAYLKAGGNSLATLDRELTLSELVMRHLITRADHLTEEQMQASDAREDLATEAKLRAEKAAKEAERVQGVSLGAPPKDEAEAPADGVAEDAPEGDAAQQGDSEAPADTEETAKADA